MIRSSGDALFTAGARALLERRFCEADRERMHELAVKNQAGALGEAEQHELESFRRVGRLPDLLGARGRPTLQRCGTSA